MKAVLDTQKAVQYVTKDIWRIREKDLPRSRSILIRGLRVIILSLRGLGKDQLALRASSLTFYSLLSLVPIVAMLFAIAKGFGFQQVLEKTLLQQLEGQEEVVRKILDFSQSFLDSVTGGLVAGVGLVLLLYTIIKILSHTENAFNDIWGIRQSRGLGRKISDYLALMLVCPMIFLLSSTLTVFISSGVKLVVTRIALLETVGPVIFFLLKLLPYGVLWVLFTLVYIVLPNTKVRFASGLLGGVIAGTLYQLFQWGYIRFQIGVANYNAIYGSFAALPLFFVWLQVSWYIVLFGAEICFAHQNVETFEYEEDCLNASSALKRLLSLRVLHLLIFRFTEGQDPMDARQISHELEIPIRLVHQILFELIAANLVSEVRVDDRKAAGFQPARDPEVLTVKYVIDALERKGSDSVPVAPSEELQRLTQTLAAFSDLLEKSPANRKLKDI
ncbi:MAG: YihY family inner membrane protein [Deltaproteobacteria bacterium]|nr:YihY family inner membrane protein [Deltaproteobacteria bacterium]